MVETSCRIAGNAGRVPLEDLGEGDVSAAMEDGPSTQDRILDAALAAFADRGVEATSLDSLAATIGVRKQTILYWFSTKEQLLLAVVDHAVAELGGRLSDAALSARPRRSSRSRSSSGVRPSDVTPTPPIVGPPPPVVGRTPAEAASAPRQAPNSLRQAPNRRRFGAEPVSSATHRQAFAAPGSQPGGRRSGAERPTVERPRVDVEGRPFSSTSSRDPMAAAEEWPSDPGSGAKRRGAQDPAVDVDVDVVLADRLAAVVDAVFRLGRTHPQLLAMVREVARVGPPATTHLLAAVEPLVDTAVAALPDGTDEDRVRVALLAAGAQVVGLATEAEVRVDLGLAPDLTWLRSRRRDLLRSLDRALSVSAVVAG